MKLRTEIKLTNAYPTISYKDNILLVGSCFSDNIGKYLDERKLPSTHNPLGIVYNPISIFKHMSFYARNPEDIDSDDLWAHNGVYSHRDFHSSNNRLSAEQFLIDIRTQLIAWKEMISGCNLMFITLGTAWVYRDLKDKVIVGNCHKKPNKDFKKELLKIEDIVLSWGMVYDFLMNINPKMDIVFTVSPVKHIKNGLVDDSRSKSILIESCHQLTEKSQNTHYFPSYEILKDDLRDYRFYDEDLIHPSKVAIDYIWDQFKSAFLSPQTASLSDRIHSITRAKQHNPFNPEHSNHRDFCKNQLATIREITNSFPTLNFSEEVKYFNSFI